VDERAFDPEVLFAIIGGGPAGLTTALSLVREAPELGSRIVVLERATYPREKICAGAVAGRGLQILSSLGVRPTVPAVRVSGFSFLGAHGASTARVPRVGWVVRRREFDAALVDAVVARGVRVIDSCKVRSLTDRGGTVHIESEAGSIVAGAVVGADGIASIVRKHMGIGPGGMRAQVVEADTGWAPGDDREYLRFDSRDRSLVGYAWDFPTPLNGRIRVSRGIYDLRPVGWDKTPTDASALLDARLHQFGVTPDAPFRRFSERGYEVGTPVVSGRCMLVGESAGIDPITGEGIAPAIEAGLAAGRHLARVWRGETRVGAWQSAFERSAVGRDLAVRSRLARLCYGMGRPLADRLLSRDETALNAGARYFAGLPARWGSLARLVASLGGAAVESNRLVAAR